MNKNRTKERIPRDTLSPRIPIAYIDIRYSVHATEDPNKVIKAVQHILPTRYVDQIIFKSDNLRGYYGNPISLFKTRIKKKEIIRAFIENLSSQLNELDKETLLREIDLHLENGSLYMRLDKQTAIQGELEFSSIDSIRVRIRFKKKKIEDITQICRDLELI